MYLHSKGCGRASTLSRTHRRVHIENYGPRPMGFYFKNMTDVTRFSFERMRADKRTLHKRNYLIKKNGGISRQRNFLELSPYGYILEKQGGVCAICKKKCSSGRALAIDHCHKTNKVRGLLCTRCNRGLGFFLDRPDLLVKASEYLKQNG